MVGLVPTPPERPRGTCRYSASVNRENAPFSGRWLMIFRGSLHVIKAVQRTVRSSLQQPCLQVARTYAIRGRGVKVRRFPQILLA